MLWELLGAGSRASGQAEGQDCHACCVGGCESAPGCSYSGNVRNKGSFMKGVDLEDVGLSCVSDLCLVLPPRWEPPGTPSQPSNKISEEVNLGNRETPTHSHYIPLSSPSLFLHIPRAFTPLHGLASPTSLSQPSLSRISFTGTKILSSAAIKGKDKIRVPVSLFLEWPNPVLLSPSRNLKMAVDQTITN